MSVGKDREALEFVETLANLELAWSLANLRI